MNKILIAAVLAVSVAGCASAPGGKYKGVTYYYTENGIDFSCREPKPYRGGNCKPDALWEDGGLYDD